MSVGFNVSELGVYLCKVLELSLAVVLSIER